MYGGTASGTLLTSNAAMTMSGGASYHARVSATAYLFVDGGTAYDTGVYGGFIEASAGGSTVYTVVSGGVEYVAYASDATRTIIEGNGSQYLFSGATAFDTLIISGTETIAAGAVDSGATVSASGQQYVYGAANGTQLSGGAQYVESGGGAYYAVILDYGVQVIESAGDAYADTVGGNGTAAFVEIETGGTGARASVLSGGNVYVEGGASYDDVIHNGGEVYVQSGTASNTTIKTGGTMFVAGGGSAVPTATISGFAAGDRVTLAALPYSSTYKAVVSSAAIVTVSAGAHDYLLHIAGAVVGESNFVLTSAGSGTVLTVSGAVGAATRMSFISPAAVTSEPATERTFLDGALAYHRGALRDFAPHAVSGHVAGAIPDLLIVPRGGTSWFFPHGNHPVFAADP